MAKVILKKKIDVQSTALSDVKSYARKIWLAGLGAYAKVGSEGSERIRGLAIEAFEVLGCSGLARVDVFLTDEGEVLINEINSLPGFTRISMYPKLWQAAGMSYSELVSRLIELALERHAGRKALKISR